MQPMPTHVYIGTEKFNVELNEDGELKAFVHEKKGYRLEERKPVVQNHKASLQFFLHAITDEWLSKGFPASYQEKGKEIYGLMTDRKTPAIVRIKQRWEDIFWSYYNREGRFPVFQGIRREEMLSNYINDALTMLPMKVLRELISDTKEEDDMAQKEKLVVACMKRILATEPKAFRDLQNTYFKNRELKSQQFDRSGNTKIKIEAVIEAKKSLSRIFDSAESEIAKIKIEAVIEAKKSLSRIFDSAESEIAKKVK